MGRIHTNYIYVCVYGWWPHTKGKGAVYAGLQPLERGDICMYI